MKHIKSEITIFLSFILTFIIMLVMTIFYSIIVNASKNASFYISRIALKNTFSEYNKEVFDKYDLFVIDGSYYKKYDEENIKNRFSKYVDYNIETYNHLNLKIGKFLKLSLNNLEIDGLKLATDNNGIDICAQAMNYVKIKYGLDYFNSLKDLHNITGNMLNNKKFLKIFKKDNHNYFKNFEKKKQFKNFTKNKNPLKEFSDIKSKDILDLILLNNQNISNKQISDKVPSNRTLNIGYEKIKTKKRIYSSLDKLAFTIYAFDHLNFNTNKNFNNVLNYEIEYLLGNSNNDRENFKSVLKKIISFRQALNFSYLLSSTTKKAEAKALAITLTGIFGIPSLVEATKYLILLTWAYGESVIDVKALLQNKKVALIKNDASWQLKLTNLKTLSGDIKNQKNGLSYKDYLKILLNMERKEKICMRFLDLVEANIRKTNKNKHFKIDNCILGIKFHPYWSICNQINYDYSCAYEYGNLFNYNFKNLDLIDFIDAKKSKYSFDVKLNYKQKINNP